MPFVRCVRNTIETNLANPNTITEKCCANFASLRMSVTMKWLEVELKKINIFFRFIVVQCHQCSSMKMGTHAISIFISISLMCVCILGPWGEGVKNNNKRETVSNRFSAANGHYQHNLSAILLLDIDLKWHAYMRTRQPNTCLHFKVDIAKIN